MSDAANSADRAEKRRAVLESLHIQEVNPGRLVEGLKDTDRVLVASFNSEVVAKRFHHELSQMGIRSWVRSNGVKTSVEVANRHRLRAFEHFEQFRYREPDFVNRRAYQRFDFAIIGGTLGAVMGVFAFTFDLRIALVAWIGFIVNGAYIGSVIDPYRRRRNGRSGQFTIVDLLLLTAAVAALFGAIKFLLDLAPQWGA